MLDHVSQPVEGNKEKKLLVTGGSGGVGSILVQFAKTTGIHITATCSAKNVDFVRSLGADEVIDYKAQSPPPQGFDLAFDCVGGQVLNDAFEALKYGGKMVTIAGDDPDAPFTFMKLLGGVRMLIVQGIRKLFGARSLSVVVVLNTAEDHKMLEHVAALAEQGKIKQVYEVRESD